MTDEAEQDASDHWQTQLYEASYRFSGSLRELNDTNPWPENPALEQAINTLATELWDCFFTLTEVRTALTKAAADLPRYTGGREVRR